jgi:hypothetical protein
MPKIEDTTLTNPYIDNADIDALLQQHKLSVEAMRREERERSEQSAIAHLASCESIRKKLELPVESLALIDQVLHREMVHTLRPTHFAIDPMKRAPLRVRSLAKVAPTQPGERPTTVIGRPQTPAMRIEEIEIIGHPEHWQVIDIQVGNRSQFPNTGEPIHGRMFAKDGLCRRFATETLQTAMDFAVIVQYVGPDPDGEIFEMLAMGSFI